MNETKQLKQKFNLLLLLTSVLVLVCTYLLFFKNEQNEFIRVKGIIVEDNNGKERILIGAPVPYAKNRVRTDTARVWKYWGNDEKEFMEWYKDYDHSNYGILILDSLGFDRVAIGNHVPDLSFGQRIGPLTGMIINDENGTERSGYGLLNINGENRMNLGLDDKYGIDRVSLTVDENGIYGLKIFDKNSKIFLGKTDSINPYLKSNPNFSGLLIDDNKGDINYTIDVNNKDNKNE